MVRTRLIVLALLALALGAVPSAASEEPPPVNVHDMTRDEQRAHWALSYRPITQALRDQVMALAKQSDRSADLMLRWIGEPARRVLMEAAATNEQLASRWSGLRAWMQSLQDEVEVLGLHRDLTYLAGLGAAGQKRIARMVPTHAPTDGSAPSWCWDHAGQLRWEPTLDHYVVVGPWAADQAPRRWRNRDTMDLANTTELLSGNMEFTAECWVKWPTNSYQSLLGDEAWPGMSGHVPVDRECGFTIRRRPHNRDTAVIDFTMGVHPRGWWKVASPPLLVSSQWEHIAVCSDGRVVRIFRNGALVAARDIRRVIFARGIRDVVLGVPRNGWNDRRANFDLRGFRLSEVARYRTEFTPPQHFGVDDETIARLDFVGGSLRDASGNGHHATGEGHWVPAHDAASLAESYAQLGIRGTRPIVVAEAERGGHTSDWYAAERSQFSEGTSIEIWSDRDPGPPGHELAIPFHVPTEGKWRVHLVGGGLHRVGREVSPFAWQIDDGDTHPVLVPLPTVVGLLGRPNLDASPLGMVELAAGAHTLRLHLLSRRRTPDTRWSLWVDAILLQPQ